MHNKFIRPEYCNEMPLEKTNTFEVIINGWWPVILRAVHSCAHGITSGASWFGKVAGRFVLSTSKYWFGNFLLRLWVQIFTMMLCYITCLRWLCSNST